jgi:ribosomal protein S18 acetylase RimI-like enzyme
MADRPSSKRARTPRSGQRGTRAAGALKIRVATRRDLPVLVEHRLAMWRDIGGHSESVLARHAPVYRRWLEREWRKGQCVVFLVETPSKEAAASGAVWFMEDHPRPGHSTQSGYLMSIYTAPAFRQRGLASRIVRACVRECKRRRVSRATLHASVRGRSVYAKLGFERSWEMRRRLSPSPGRRGRDGRTREP